MEGDVEKRETRGNGEEVEAVQNTLRTKGNFQARGNLRSAG